MSAQEITVPDIGDFSDIPVIEIHVAAGDTVFIMDYPTPGTCCAALPINSSSG